jgi:hypothetical protein
MFMQCVSSRDRAIKSRFSLGVSAVAHQIAHLRITRALNLKIRVSMVRFRPWPPLKFKYLQAPRDRASRASALHLAP